MRQWLQENLVGLLALGLAAIVAVGGLIAFFMTTLVTTADVEAMIAPLATDAAVAALPTEDDLDSINGTVGDLRETVAALSSTVQALSSTVDAQNQIVRTLGETVTQATNTVIALSGTVDQVNEAAARADEAVGTLEDRLESLRDIVAPLVPCIIELNRMWFASRPLAAFGDVEAAPFSMDARAPIATMTVTTAASQERGQREDTQLPASCEQARARARAE